MDLSDAIARLRSGNAILFSKDSPCLAELSSMLSRSDRRTVVLWALECAEVPVSVLVGRHPRDGRPSAALAMARSWAEGSVKMPMAKRAILDVHSMARAVPPEDAALCHAVGQACSVVHTVGHAMGLPMYELTSIVREHGADGCRGPVGRRIGEYTEALSRLSSADKDAMSWAEFLR